MSGERRAGTAGGEQRLQGAGKGVGKGEGGREGENKDKGNRI